MRSKGRGWWVLALAACVLQGCSGTRQASGEKRPVIGVSLLNLSNELIVTLNRALEDEAKKAGVELIVNDAQRSAEKQVQQVESFIAQKVDAIILNPCEVEASSPAVEKALAAGIPIVNVNSETRAAPTAFVGSRDEEAGRIAMEYLAQRLNGSGNIAIMQGFLGQAAQIKRDAGAREVLAKTPGLKLIAQQTGEWDRAKSLTLMENWLQSYTRIDAVFAENDEMAMGALIALEQAKRKEKVVLAGVDAIPDALEAIRDGRLDATVFQDARGQGSAAVQTVMKILRRQAYEKQVFIPFQLVTRQNVGQFLR